MNNFLGHFKDFMVGATGFEPVTPAVSRQCSTTELRTQIMFIIAKNIILSVYESFKPRLVVYKKVSK